MDIVGVISSSSSSSDSSLEEFEEVTMATMTILTNTTSLMVEELLDMEDEAIDKSERHMRRHIHRAREMGNKLIMLNYFGRNPTFTDDMFTRRFRMNRPLFLRVFKDVYNDELYFRQRHDATGMMGLSAIQKFTAAVRMLTYGNPADAIDEYCRIGETAALECVKYFCKSVVKIYGEEYLRTPTDEDISRLLDVAEQRGFPRMLVGIDCMHWRWKNCPTAWHGQFSGHVAGATVILKAVASWDTWIWHAFFGLPGSCNDINVLERSPVFVLASGKAPKCNFTVNGNEFDMGYYLADGIYPQWATLIQTISSPLGLKRKLFAKKQESCRKDVERAFGILQARWATIRGQARMWHLEDLESITKACIILHNMIFEGDRDTYSIDGVETDRYDYKRVENDVNVVPSRNISHSAEYKKFIEMHKKIRDKSAHLKLKNDIIEHAWSHHGA